MKLLQRPLIRAILKSVPFVGEVVDNLDAETVDSPKGSINPGDAITKVIRILALLALAYFVMKGNLDIEQAGDIKELISQ
jgi:hypothetical protein